jgi:hypothetical protein
MQAACYADFNALLIEMVNEIVRREMGEAAEVLIRCCPLPTVHFEARPSFWGQRLSFGLIS